MLIGVNGVPLYYMMRETDNPYGKGELTNFIDNKIAYYALKGNYYQADLHIVHQELVLLPTGEQLYDWNKANLRYMDGKRSMKAPRNNFAGKFNATRKFY